MMKKNEKIILFLLFGLIIHQNLVHCQVMMIFTALSFIWDAFDKINTVHDTYSKFSTPSTQDLMDKSEEIIASIDNLGNRMDEKIDKAMTTLLTRLPRMNEITNDVRLLNGYIGRIDELFDDLKEYVKDNESFVGEDLTYLLKTFLSRDGDDVQGSIIGLYNLIAPQKLGKLKKSLWLLLAQESQDAGLDLCDTEGPPQQRLIDLYDVVVETEMRVFTMTGFGYVMRGYLDKKNYTKAIKRAELKFLARVKQYVLVLRNSMNIASRQFRRCDPDFSYRRDFSFYEFQRYKSGENSFAVSLRPVRAIRRRQMVITGVKLEFENNILTFVIEQAEIVRFGKINENMKFWRKSERIEYDEDKDGFYKRFDNGGDVEMVLDNDIAILSGDNSRIHLDSLSLPGNLVLTGVRFGRLTDEPSKPLQLELFGTPYDYETGRLSYKSSIWVTPEWNNLKKKPKERTEYKEVDFKEPDEDMHTGVDSKPNSYIDLNWENQKEDGSETITPLIDALPVTSNPSFPLGGVSLYHKKGAGYSGLLTVVLEGFNKAPYTRVRLNDEPL